MKSKTISEPARKVPVVHECDICVVGGSCTGVFAAVRAARLGAKVAVVENNGFFGGAATAGLVPLWHSLRDMGMKRRIIGGMTQEVIARLGKRGAVKNFEPKGGQEYYVLNTEELKIELDEFVRESGVRPFLHAKFVAPAMEDGHLKAVVIEDKTGRRAIAAKYFIDATGDGDLVARMGFPFTRLEGIQPPTAVTIFENFTDIFEKNPGVNVLNEIFNKKYPNALKNGFQWGTTIPGRESAYMLAGTRVHNADCSDADQLTSAEMESRRQARAICDILRRHVKGGKNITLSNLPSYIGIRETRHPECLHSLTGDELLNGKSFDDAVAYGTYPSDVHHSHKPGITFRWLDGRECYCEPGKPSIPSRWRDESKGVTPFYQIPYRCLVPRNSRNVLVAGRLIGADREAYGAIRVMVNCNQTGEAAGVASWLALKSNASVDQVDARLLRKTMTDGGSVMI